MDTRQERRIYANSQYADKRLSVLAFLKGFQGKGEVFDTLFAYLINNPTWATETELDEIFEIVMRWLEADNLEKLEEQALKLSDLQDKMRLMREEEEREKSQDRPEDVLTAF